MSSNRQNNNTEAPTNKLDDLNDSGIGTSESEVSPSKGNQGGFLSNFFGRKKEHDKASSSSGTITPDEKSWKIQQYSEDSSNTSNFPYLKEGDRKKLFVQSKHQLKVGDELLVEVRKETKTINSDEREEIVMQLERSIGGRKVIDTTVKKDEEVMSCERTSEMTSEQQDDFEKEWLEKWQPLVDRNAFEQAMPDYSDESAVEEDSS